MVSVSRVEQNLMAYIDDDLVPKMPKLDGIAFAAMAPFVVRSKLPAYMRMVNGTELVSDDSIDVDALYREFKSKAMGKWPIEMAGFKFYEADLDKLYHYLVR